MPPPHHRRRRRRSSTASSFLPSCFSSTTTTTAAAAAASLTTSLYQTPLGLVILTWSRSFLSRHLHLHLLSSPHSPSSSLHLSLHPFFSSLKGSSPFSSSTTLFFNFSHARFPASPEPLQGTFSLSLGDFSLDERCLVVRREHVFGTRRYKTKARFGGREWGIEIECVEEEEEEPRLRMRFDGEIVVEVRHLRWKFRGNERVVVDGQAIQVSWDVYNWLFDEENNEDGYGLFTFRFENTTTNIVGGEMGIDRTDVGVVGSSVSGVGLKERMMYWGTTTGDTCGLEFERKKIMRKKTLLKSRSPSSSSFSSASSGCGSVMEWESVEENELKGGQTGFSLLVYAWKK